MLKARKMTRYLIEQKSRERAMKICEILSHIPLNLLNFIEFGVLYGKDGKVYLEIEVLDGSEREEIV